MPGRKRIVLVCNEILGLVRTGGAGTANTFLAFALAQRDHDVEILFTDSSIEDDLDQSWAAEYAERAIGIRRLETPAEEVVPGGMTHPYAVLPALQTAPPDVVIANDWGGPAYAALRLRRLGLAFADTTFVVYCHGTNGWVYDAHRRLRRSPRTFELEALERASVELADVVVSPSAYMLDWMRARGWQLPQSVVAPYFTRSALEGLRPSQAPRSPSIRRIAFFGRLEDRKGIAPFVDALNALGEGVLAEREIVFVGKPTQAWPVDRVRKRLSPSLTARFETDLDQPAALRLLAEPGTLAVMPSLVDNSPNVVYECIEHGIPFLAGDKGGGPELVAPEDRSRAFVDPTVEGVRRGLEHLLAAGVAQPVGAAFDADAIAAAWEGVVEAEPVRAPVVEPTPSRVAAVVVDRGGNSKSTRESLAAQTRPPDEIVIVEPGRRDLAVEGSAEEFLLLLEDGDDLDANCLETLLRAQAAVDADVVTAGLWGRRGKRDLVFLFVGEARELGLIGNHYGLVALCRRSVLGRASPVTRIEGDAEWPFLASLALGDARIVSVPRPLGRTLRSPGSAATEEAGSNAALAVAQLFERECPYELRGLGRLTASLAARAAEPVTPPSLGDRLRWIWEHEGAAGLARRAEARLRRPGRLSEAEEPPGAPDEARAPASGDGAGEGGSTPPAGPGPPDGRPRPPAREQRRSGSRS